MANSPVTEDCRVVVMPDVHMGKGATIGYTQTISKEHPRVIPSTVSVDIGCGMLVLKISKKAGDKLFNKPGLKKFDKIMHTEIPSGMAHRKTLHKFAKDFSRIRELIADADYDKELYALSSLGSGNHFVEVAFFYEVIDLLQTIFHNKVFYRRSYHEDFASGNTACLVQSRY